MPLLTRSAIAVSPQARLSVPYADTRADDLSYALDLPPQPALRTLRLEIARLELDLRILGYSHQVVIAGSGGEPLLSETVARLSGGDRRTSATALPRFHEQRGAAGPAGILRYSVSTAVAPLGGDSVAIEDLMRGLDGDERAILGVFPGHPHAFTGLRAGEAAAGGVQWRSWHAYPGSDELVQTRSRLVRNPA